MPNKYYIKKTNKGIEAKHIPGKELEQDVWFETLFAINKYGFLLQEGETLNGPEFAALIRKKGAKRHKELLADSILISMPN
jgi:hypothetical protein